MIDKKRAKAYCKEYQLIENYDKAIADSDNIWCCHHRAEILPCGRFSKPTLIKFGLYWHRPPEELIYLLQSEHQRLHMKGTKFSEQHKTNLRKSSIGKHCGAKHPRFGVFGKDNPLYGRHWWTNGIENKLEYKCPDKGWRLGRTI